MITSLLQFITSRSGRLVLMVVGILTLAYFIRGQRSSGEGNASENRLQHLSPVSGEMAPPSMDQPNGPSASREWASNRKIEKLTLPPYRPPAPVVTPSKPGAKAPPLVLFHRKAAKEEPKTAQASSKRPDLTARLLGQVVRCQLISAVQTTGQEVPILAKITDNVTVQGRLVIAAGTELHGTARAARIRDRVQTKEEWLGITPNGKHFTLNGIGLQHDQNPRTKAFGRDDMSFGIKGVLKDTDALIAHKRFAAAILSAASRSSRDTVRSVFGEQSRQSLENVARDSVDGVASQYLRQLEEQIQGDGRYVSVPAGMRFYVAVRSASSPAIRDSPPSILPNP